MHKLGENTEIIINLADSLKLNSLWTISYLDNSTRTFLYKFYNNILGYNHVVAHFVRGHSPYCTFCDITRNPIPERETPLHLFYTCRTVEPVVLEFFCWVRTEAVRNENTVSRADYFGIFKNVDPNKAWIFTIVCKLFMKYIWDCKLRFSLPRTQSAKIIVSNELESIVKYMLGAHHHRVI